LSTHTGAKLIELDDELVELLELELLELELLELELLELLELDVELLDVELLDVELLDVELLELELLELDVELLDIELLDVELLELDNELDDELVELELFEGLDELLDIFPPTLRRFLEYYQPSVTPSSPTNFHQLVSLENNSHCTLYLLPYPFCPCPIVKRYTTAGTHKRAPKVVIHQAPTSPMIAIQQKVVDRLRNLIYNDLVYPRRRPNDQSHTLPQI